ncbi:5'-deoxyadenosine deaminase [bacterium]|nr:MAG: 5'-deoxyadenosine deaminase [bacterium]
MKRIIKNGKIVTMNAAREVLRGDILIEGDRIEKVGRLNRSDFENAKTMDASELTVSPGFVQTHVHLCQTLFRNLADDLELLDWLKIKIWPFEGAHSPQSIALSARIGLTELIKCGTTTIMDMATVHHTDRVFEEIEKSGIRAICGKAMMDDCAGAPKSLTESMRWSIDESLRLKKDWHGKSNGRLRFAFAPRFVLSCSEKLLCEVRDIAAEEKLLIHTHSSENRGELDEVVRRYQKSNIEYFHHINLTGERLCLAHCIWLNSNEMDILQETQTKVLHCPSSNLKLGSGIAPVPEMLDRGITVSLGADGAPCNNNLDIFQEMRLAALIQKPRVGPKSLTAEKVFEMATIQGARALGMEKEIGSIEPGKKADLVLMDLENVHSMPEENIYSSIIYSARSTDVKTVIVDGKVVMKNRELRTIDEQQVVKNIRPQIKKLLNRI